MNEPTRDQELLARAIRASGLTPRQYAKRVLIRDPRMIRRWLAGQYQLPKEVRAHLEQLEKSRLGKEPTMTDAESLLSTMGDFCREVTQGMWDEPTRAEDRLGEGAD